MAQNYAKTVHETWICISLLFRLSAQLSSIHHFFPPNVVVLSNQRCVGGAVPPFNARNKQNRSTQIHHEPVCHKLCQVESGIASVR